MTQQLVNSVQIVCVLIVDEITFESVHFLLQLLHGTLGELGARFRFRQLHGHRANLMLILFLFQVCLDDHIKDMMVSRWPQQQLSTYLLLGHFERLEIVADDAQLFLKLDDFTAFCVLSLSR